MTAEDVSAHPPDERGADRLAAGPSPYECRCYESFTSFHMPMRKCGMPLK